MGNILNVHLTQYKNAKPIPSYNPTKYENIKLVVSRSPTKYEMVIRIIGDAQIGKSSMIMRLCDDQFGYGHITIGERMHEKKITFGLDEHKIVTIKFVDDNPKKFRSMGKSMYAGCDGIMLAFDINDPESFDNSARWLKEVERMTHAYCGMILVATKCDSVCKYSPESSCDTVKILHKNKNSLFYYLPEEIIQIILNRIQLSENKYIYDNDINEFTYKHNLEFIKTSSKNNTNIKEAFVLLANSVIEKWDVD